MDYLDALHNAGQFQNQNKYISVTFCYYFIPFRGLLLLDHILFGFNLNTKISTVFYSQDKKLKDTYLKVKTYHTAFTSTSNKPTDQPPLLILFSRRWGITAKLMVLH